MSRVGEILYWAAEKLSQAGIEEAGLESEIMLREELHLSRAELYLNLNNNIEFPALIDSFRKKVMLRAGHVPLAYILKKVRFMGLDFLVDERAMIPRQETELLVEVVVNCVNNAINRTATILDIGTGSGNIAVSIAKLVSNAEIYATDISGEAIELARQNAILNNVAEKISFIQCDLFSALNGVELNGGFDIVVSNPPYVPSYDIEKLQPEIQAEPHIALDGGEDGLAFYRRIIQDLPCYLKKGGYLFLETGSGQAGKVIEMILESRSFSEWGTIKDYNGIERIIWGCSGKREVNG